MRHFPADAEIALAADDRAATITSGRSQFKLPVFPIADLLEPRILGQETGRVELDAKIARDLFMRPAFAAADDASRPYLRGIFLHNTGDRSCRGRHRWIPVLPYQDACHDDAFDWIAR